MSRREYPYVGSDRAIKGKKQCHCCREIAIRKVEIQVDWFRGNDEVLQLCELHYAFVGKQAWKELFDAAATEKEARRMCNEHARERAIQRKARRESVANREGAAMTIHDRMKSTKAQHEGE